MSGRPVRTRGTDTYVKEPLAHDELVLRCQKRGLFVPDQERAERYLRHIGYYRLSPYMIPFQDPGTDHSFRPGSSFDEVLDLYVFDRKLRLVVLDALERVEVAIRSSITDHMATSYENAFWYQDENLFKNTQMHRKLVQVINKSCDDQLRRKAEPLSGTLSPRSALEHYLVTYGEPKLPPSWIVLELLTIGQLSSMYCNLAHRRDRTSIARPLGLNEPLLTSWLPVYVRVRNICAHHGRLWNAGLGVHPQTPKSDRIPWVASHGQEDNRSRQSLYPVLVSLQVIMRVLSPHSKWAIRLSHLLDEHPDVPWEPMGIPKHWRDDPFWTKHLKR